MLTAGDGPDPSSPTGAGRVLSLIRDGEAVTRADLARRTGLARSTRAPRREGRGPPAPARRPARGGAPPPRPRLRGGRQRADGRPPADGARLQPRRRRRAR